MSNRRDDWQMGVYRVSPAWRVRQSIATQSASDLLDGLVPGAAVVALSKGQVSFLDVLLAMLDAVGGPADVTCSSWTSGATELRKLKDLVTSGRLRSFRLLLDRSVAQRCPAEAAMVQSLFGSDSVRLAPTHAKLAAARSDSRALALFSSANLNHNSRLESFVVVEDAGVVTFIESTLAEWFGASAPACASDWSASSTAHSKAFEGWHAEPGQRPRGPGRPRREPAVEFAGDGVLDHDHRRPGISIF